VTWDQISGWYDWEPYYESVVNDYGGGVLVEVGCYLGRSLCHLGTLVRESGKPFTVIGVDHCLGSGLENGRDNHVEAVKRNGQTFAGELWNNVVACGLHDIVSLIVGESGRVSNLFPDESLTMVFIDAGHNYADVHRDIRLWYPKVRLGGEIAGDDYGIEGQPPVWPGVRRAVDELFPDRRLVSHDAWEYRRR